MNKRKVLMLALSLCMVAILAVGGTLAYFTDKDSATNVFTVGNVDIELTENFEQNAVLVPATGSAQNDTLKNGITKEIFVESTGSEEAYVRVHIAIPALLDDGDPNFDASKNVLHFNYYPESVGEGLWDWSKSADDDKFEGNWNAYKQTIDGVAYNVYVVTYTTKLEKGDKTESAMHQVYLDSKVTNEDVTKIKSEIGENWQILVVAEGAQADGFGTAFDALNAAFGTPSAAANPWNNYGKVTE